MSPPKHLWSGDWQEESAKNARRRSQAPAPDEERPASEPRTPPHEPAPRPPVRVTPQPRRRRQPQTRSARPPLRIDLRMPRYGVVLAFLAAVAVALAVIVADSGGGTGSGSGQAYLGLALDPAAANGAVVDQVQSGSPADQAGIQPGDIVTSMDGRFVNAAGDIDQIVASHHPGDRIAIGIQRGLANITTQATLASRPAGSSSP